MKILVVDDEPVIRTGIKTVIQRSQKDWVLLGDAIDGIDALEKIARETPDVIITDIRMPEMDGLDLIKAIKPRLPQTLFIIISGYAEFSFAQEAIKLGAMDYLLKPIRPGDLIAVLEKADRIFTANHLSQETETRLREENERLIGEIHAILTKIEKGPDASRQLQAQQYRKVIALAMEYIRQNYNQDLSLKKIAAVVYMNPSYFSDLFKKETGEGFSEYLTRIRLVKAQELLRSRVDLKSYEIAELVGYKDAQYFCQIFKKVIGVTPTEFREGNAGAHSSSPRDC